MSSTSPSMTRNASDLKRFLAARHQEIALAHRSGATGFDTCSALTATMDEAIRSAFASLAHSKAAHASGFSSSAHEHIAVLALGGYGRGELCPKSDIDVMVLCHPGSRKDEIEGIAKAFLHELWNAGLDVGHSVRTVEEAIGLHGKTVDSWASMLESRYVCGSKQLAETFFAQLRARSSSADNSWFIEGVFKEMESRHERYGNSVKLLEPNVKKSAGGLRDFHAIYWLFLGTDPSYRPDQAEPVSPASAWFLDILRDRDVIDADEYGAAVEALQFLLRSRHEMHYLRQSLHDTLEYALQCEVAEGLGYGNRNVLHAVEVFMREYYVRARAIYQLNRRLSHGFREAIDPYAAGTQPAHPRKTIDEIFFLHDDLLSSDPSVKQFTSTKQLFEALLISAENDVDMDNRLRQTIERSVHLLTNESRSSEELSGMFGRILRTKRVAKTLHTMNELNVLGRYIPEFGDLVAFFQHNVYHYFTADEHTLIAIANVEGLREQQGVLREVFRNLRRKDILYLAILLHDIAKPHGVADHEITGVRMAEEILRRLNMNDATPDVTFLVRNHLAMEQVAFRRNVHDPETIKEFAAKFERPEQLDYLYLLTYADLSAVNINVWTEWKSSLLQELYQRAFEVLTRNLRGVQVDDFHQSRHLDAVQEIVDRLGASMPREHVERHLQGIRNESYISLFSEDEIGQHIHKSASDETVSTMFTHQEGHTEITIITEDAPFALAKFCAVLAANDANIFDANVFTREDGIIIDRFRVSDASTRQQIEQRVCTKITTDLNQVMRGELDIEHLFQAHRRKWKRRPRVPSNPNVRIDVEFEDNPRYTIIDVYAPDSLGFLYRITETISKLGLDIYFAKIGTRMDGIVDAFYTLDRTGKPVTDTEHRQLIKSEILATIKALQEQELTS